MQGQFNGGVCYIVTLLLTASALATLIIVASSPTRSPAIQRASRSTLMDSFPRPVAAQVPQPRSAGMPDLLQPHLLDNEIIALPVRNCPSLGALPAQPRADAACDVLTDRHGAPLCCYYQHAIL